MKYINSFKQLAMLAAIMAVIGLSIGRASARVDHHVQVRNNSNKKIIKILASTDGENYAGFNIENGIKPGQMVEISWNKSNGQCEWYLKAVYADNSKSAPAHFDLCQNDAILD